MLFKLKKLVIKSYPVSKKEREWERKLEGRVYTEEECVFFLPHVF